MHTVFIDKTLVVYLLTTKRKTSQWLGDSHLGAPLSICRASSVGGGGGGGGLVP